MQREDLVQRRPPSSEATLFLHQQLSGITDSRETDKQQRLKQLGDTAGVGDRPVVSDVGSVASLEQWQHGAQLPRLRPHPCLQSAVEQLQQRPLCLSAHGLQPLIRDQVRAHRDVPLQRAKSGLQLCHGEVTIQRRVGLEPAEELLHLPLHSLTAVLQRVRLLDALLSVIAGRTNPLILPLPDIRRLRSDAEDPFLVLHHGRSVARSEVTTPLLQHGPELPAVALLLGSQQLLVHALLRQGLLLLVHPPVLRLGVDVAAPQLAALLSRHQRV